jgi:hypothetical protein
MNLFIVGEPKFTCLSPYKGTEREYPYYSDEHPIKTAFLLYLQEIDEGGCMHDLSMARKIVEAYSNLEPPVLYEIIAVTKNNEPLDISSKGDSVFLGYDLSYRMGDSLISSLNSSARLSEERPWEKGVPHEIIVFDKLIAEHFISKLNTNGLFDDYLIANFCLECMTSILNLAPQFYEPGSYEVVRVYKIVQNPSE